MNVSTVILASTENYPDALVASTAAARTGAPILLTANDTLSAETRQTIATMTPDEVVLVGGPQVLSPMISDTVNETANVTRLWGFTRYGTSVEVAEYFWPTGTDRAVVVQNDRQDSAFAQLAAATEIARGGERPVYLTPSDTVPAITVASLQNLGVDQVTVVGTNVTGDYRSTVESANISVAETVTAETPDRIRSQLQDRTLPQLDGTQQVVVVASDTFEHPIATANAPNATTVHVTSQEELQNLTTALNGTGVQTVTVVGSEQLGQSAAVALEQAGIQVNAVLGDADTVARLNRQFILQHADAFEQENRQWMQERDTLFQERQDRLRQHAARLLVQTERMMDADTPEAANASLQRAARLFQDQAFAGSLQQVMQARDRIRLQQFQETVGTAAFEEQVQAEMQSLAQFRQELQQINPTFATAFTAAPLSTQFWIIETVRTMPEREQRQVVTEAASTLEEQEELLPQFEQARQRVRAGNITVNATNRTQPPANATNVTNRTNATGTNLTNITDMNTTNATNATNVTNATNGTTLRENESTRTVTVAGERFDHETRCLPGDAARNSTVRIGASTEHNTLAVTGTVILPAPHYNATSNVSIDEDEQTADSHITFRPRDGVGLQCLGEGGFIQLVNVSDGEWQVDASVSVRNETVAQRLEAVQVPAPADTADTGNTTGENATNTTEQNRSETAQRTVVLTDNAFDPAQISVEQGDTLVFRNDGNNTHNVNIPGLGVDRDLQPGDRFTVDVSETGTFDLRCDYHAPAMTGEISAS
jgi:putative cell wall-binding protein/plastocyanin